MTDIADANLFYVRFTNDNQYEEIEEELEDFDVEASDDLEKPIKKGTLCAAKFSLDNKWYRAKVVRSAGKGQVEV
jgi:staphylococcal nuclease domain-containing protein 1